MSEKQLSSIREANARLNIWCGAVRSGKSHSALWAFLHFCRFGADGKLVIAGRTQDTIVRNIIDPMRDILGNYVKYYVGKREIELFNRKIYVVGANDDRAEGKIRGASFAGAYVDEITLLPENFFKMLLSRLSVPGAQLFGTTNPDSPYHWLKKDFIDRANELDLRYWHFTLQDNPVLDPNYIEQIKKEYIGLWYQRFIEGKWVQAEGAIYDFFDPNLHCIDWCPHQAEYYIAGIDYGTTNPFGAVLVGINRNKYPSVWVEAEYYFDSKKAMRQKTDSEYADDMEAFFRGKHIRAIYIDPSAVSFRVELYKRGMPNLMEAKNEVLDGIRLVSKMMSDGVLKITKSCKYLIQEIQSYVWDPKSLKSGEDKPLKQSDHLSDSLRYACYSHFFNQSAAPMKPEEVDKYRREAMGDNQYNLPRFFADPMDYSQSHRLF